LARRVRTAQGRVEGLGAGGGKPGSNAREGRPVHVDRHVDIEPAERGKHDTSNHEDRRDGRSGDV
jgi:hypothetical protein